MARLTKAIKNTILSNALNKACVFERELNVRNDISDLAESVRVYSIGGAYEEEKIVKLGKKIEKLISEVPKNIDTSGYFRFDKELGVKASFGGMQVVLRYSGFDKKDEQKEVYKSISPSPYGAPILFDVDHELTKKFHLIMDEKKTVKDLRSSITINVNAMTNSVTTDKKLIEVWPEAKELIPVDIDKPIVSLPTTDVQSLNTMIGIPSEESNGDNQ